MDPRREIILTGRFLFELGLVGSHSGNLSLRRGGRIVITRHDAMIGYLSRSDLVQVPAGWTQGRNPSGSASRPLRVGAALAARRKVAPSMDLDIHRAIYVATGAKAIVHAHPVHAVALSLKQKEIIPKDVEGVHHLHRVPVVGSNTIESYREMPRLLPNALRKNRIALMCGHGSYAIGATLEEALHLTSALEFSAAVLAASRG